MSTLFHQRFSLRDQVSFVQGLTNVLASSGQEGVSNTATNDQLVAYCQTGIPERSAW